MTTFKSKLTSTKDYNETRIYLGKCICSSIFNGQLSETNFNLIESKIKKACNLKIIPYSIYNEYCYDNYIYHTNAKIDKLSSSELVDSENITTSFIDCKIDHIKNKEHNTINFNSKRNYDHVQPFSEASLKLNDYIYIKLRKNLYNYDINGPVSSYQIYIILKNNYNTIKDKTDSISLTSNIINDFIKTK